MASAFRIVILTDEHTPFDPDLGIELFRVKMDTDRLGRLAPKNLEYRLKIWHHDLSKLIVTFLLL